MKGSTAMRRTGQGTLCLGVALGLAVAITGVRPVEAFPALPLHTQPYETGPILVQPVPGSEGGTGTQAPDTEPSVADNGRQGRSAPKAAVSAAASVPSTSTVVGLIESISETCAPVGSEYRVDCIASELEVVAARLPESGDYNEARLILKDAAQELNKLSRQNVDRTKPRVRVKLPPESGRSTTQALAAVKPEAVASVNEAAIEVLENATTVLLRSAENSANRAVHYQQIAQAVDSNKVLLRS